MSFWNIVWFIFISYVFFAYLMVLFSIIGDIFRDTDTSGTAKALWIFALIVVPFISVLAYLITRSDAMAARGGAHPSL